MPKIQLKRNTTQAGATASTFVADAGQPVVALETGDVRVGDGVRAWKDLPTPLKVARVVDALGEVVMDGAFRYRGPIPGPSSSVNHTPELVNRMAKARLVGGGTVVLDPQVYCVEDLEVLEGVTLMASLRGSTSLYTTMNDSTSGQVGGTRRGTVQIRRRGPYSGGTSDKSVVKLLGNGAALVGVTISGENATGLGGAGTVPPPVLVVKGFEQRMQTVRVVNTPGIGIDWQQAQNAHFIDVHVNFCGGTTETTPAVRIWSVDATNRSTNTPTWDNLQIEQFPGIGLDVAYDSVNTTPDNATFWAEFVGIARLHIESKIDVGSALPAVRVGNVRDFTLIDPMIFRILGSGPIIQYKEQSPRAVSGTGSLTILGGSVFSYDNPAYLIELVAGNKFHIGGGANLFGYSVAAVRAQSTFGAAVTIDPSVAVGCLANHPTLPILDDARTARTLVPLIGDHRLTGHLLSQQATAASPAAVTGTNSPSLSGNATDVSGLIQFGTNATPPGAGAKVAQVIYNKPYPTQPRVVVTAGTAAAAALGPYVGPVSGTGGTIGFAIYASVAAPASQANGTFQFNYHVIG